MLAALEAAFVLFFTVFLLTIKRSYIFTFFTMMTAKQFRIKNFREAKTDLAKSNILKLHPSYYATIRQEVKDWVGDNYSTWIEERPEWFTDHLKKRIPVDMVPEGILIEAAKKKREKARRKSSVVLILEALNEGAEETRPR